MSDRGVHVGREAWRWAAMAGVLSALVLAGGNPVQAANPGQDQVSKDFQKTLTLGTGQSVRIEHKFGEVRIHGESGREVKISATIKVQASSREEAESFAQKIQIDVQQTAEGVRVKTVYPEEEKRWFHLGKNTSYSVNYDIAMPSDAPLNVRNSFGSTNASGIHAASDIENSHGSISMRDVGAARVNNSFGSIELTGAGGNVSVTDTNGSVQVSDVKGTLEVRNRFGSITAKNIREAANINGGNGTVTLSDALLGNIVTSFGSVDARNIRGDLTVHDNNGNVEVATIGGAADITNSFGNITFSDVHGFVNCKTNNGRIKGSSAGSVTIHDSFGNVELDNISGNLDADTSNGRITVRDARGAVTLRTSFGSIEASNIPKGIRATNGNGAITLTDIGADAYAKTSFGSVLAERVNGNLTVENNNGSVTARNVKGDASVRTSFSGVTMDTIGGRISVDNQNGGISVTAMRPASGCRDILLKTSFSSIRVQVPGGLGYNLSAHTSFGRISSELPVTSTGSMGGDTLNGTISGGGCQLQLNNSNGSIEITKGQ